MRIRYKQIWATLGILCVLAFNVQARNANPHQLVEEITTELLEVIKINAPTFDQSPQAYFDAVGKVLDRVVDFEAIAKHVMGKQAYLSATEDQRRRFITVFRRGLVETYGKGMMSYSNEKIIVLPFEGELAGQKRVRIDQEIHAQQAIYPVAYSMVLNPEGEWKLLNVVINGVNLGKTFRSQFAQAYKKSGGDIDKVIADWNSEESQVKA